ncbi:MAG: hypothetical protein ACYSWZ_22950 [Planctomycetota bacterium]|jgi:hypothetical protein
MKKILLTLVVLVFASPALAAVNITAAQVGDTNEVIISFDATGETNLVRAFGLNVTLSNDANVVSVTGLSVDYWVYPGTIQIAANGDISFIGSIGAEYGDLPSDTLVGPPDGNGVTLEAASLYAPVGPGSPNAPAKSGDLASIIVDANTTLCITANVSRAGATGVVMEDPDEVVTVNYGACINVNLPPKDDDCYKNPLNADYAEWDAVGKPLCWCALRQCHGDALDDMGGSIKTGFYAVGPTDLNVLIAGWLVLEPPHGLGIDTVTDGICADFAHDEGGSIKTGFYRVGPTDLNILIANWLVLEPPHGTTGIPADCVTP